MWTMEYPNKEKQLKKLEDLLNRNNDLLKKIEIPFVTNTSDIVLTNKGLFSGRYNYFTGNIMINSNYIEAIEGKPNLDLLPLTPEAYQKYLFERLLTPEQLKELNEIRHSIIKKHENEIYELSKNYKAEDETGFCDGYRVGDLTLIESAWILEENGIKRVPRPPKISDFYKNSRLEDVLSDTEKYYIRRMVNYDIKEFSGKPFKKIDGVNIKKEEKETIDKFCEILENYIIREDNSIRGFYTKAPVSLIQVLIQSKAHNLNIMADIDELKKKAAYNTQIALYPQGKNEKLADELIQYLIINPYKEYMKYFPNGANYEKIVAYVIKPENFDAVLEKYKKLKELKRWRTQLNF